jgi:hypothetical protein
MKDGLKKFKDFPAELGGSGEIIAAERPEKGLEPTRSTGFDYLGAAKRVNCSNRFNPYCRADRPHKCVLYG